MRIKSLRLWIWRRCEMAMRMAKLIATAVQTAAAELGAVGLGLALSVFWRIILGMRWGHCGLNFQGQCQTAYV